MAPFVGSFVYLWEGINNGETSQAKCDAIPDGWRNLRFDAVDVLFITPFRVTPTFGFDLGTVTGTCNLQARFDWVVGHARAQNRSIRLFATHWYGDDIDGQGFKDLNDPTKRNTFAAAVAAFFQAQAAKMLTVGGQQVPARLDGYDVDVEGAGGRRDGPPGTKVAWLVNVMAAVRSALDGIQTSTNPKFYTSISPAWNDCLDQTFNGQSIAHYVDYVNMQRYSGGRDGFGTPAVYLRTISGLTPGQLTYGISTEDTSANAQTDFDAMMNDYNGGANNVKFGGFWTWRLNNQASVFTNGAQVALYNQLHPSANLPGAPDLAKVKAQWGSGNTLQNSPNPFA